jgi:cytochrome c-type biogenesis protein CcmH
MESFNEAEAVVALRPEDPEARTHQAIVLIAIGDAATAASALDKVIAAAPTFAEALAYRGALHFQSGEAERAVAMLDRAVQADPNLAASVQPLIEAAKAGNLPSPSAPAASAAPSAGPAGGGPTTGAGPAGPSPDDISGTLALAPAAAGKVQPGDVVFLSARPPGVEGGPPTWVARIPAATFPMAFTLGPANAMLGGPTPAELVITARIDRDGNARTKGPDDLEGRSATLKPGATDVAITLSAAP